MEEGLGTRAGYLQGAITYSSKTDYALYVLRTSSAKYHRVRLLIARARTVRVLH